MKSLATAAGSLLLLLGLVTTAAVPATAAKERSPLVASLQRPNDEVVYVPDHLRSGTTRLDYSTAPRHVRGAAVRPSSDSTVETAITTSAVSTTSRQPSSSASTIGEKESQQRQREQQRSLPSTVLQLRLVNADTQRPVAGLDPLFNGAVIDVATIGTRNLTIEAVKNDNQGTNNASTMIIESVQFDWDDQVRYNVERFAPYTLCGNKDAGNHAGSYDACPNELFDDTGHVHRVTAKATLIRASDNSTITVSSSIWFRLEDSTPSSSDPVSTPVAGPPERPNMNSTLSLIDADTDIVIEDVLYDRYYVNMGIFPHINIRANPDPSFATQSVAFTVDGKLLRMEQSAPYALAGNRMDDYFSWTSMTQDGMHVIVATPYSGRNGKGRAGPVMKAAILLRNVPIPEATTDEP